MQATLLTIQPSLSIGNVGQMAIDTLISTFQFTQAGSVECSNVLPFVANDPFHKHNSGQITTSLEGITLVNIQQSI